MSISVSTKSSFGNNFDPAKKRVAVLDLSTVLDFSKPRFIVDRKRYSVSSDKSGCNHPHESIIRNRTTVLSSSFSQAPLAPPLTVDWKRTISLIFRPEKGHLQALRQSRRRFYLTRQVIDPNIAATGGFECEPPKSGLAVAERRYVSRTSLDT